MSSKKTRLMNIQPIGIRKLFNTINTELATKNILFGQQSFLFSTLFQQNYK